MNEIHRSRPKLCHLDPDFVTGQPLRQAVPAPEMGYPWLTWGLTSPSGQHVGALFTASRLSGVQALLRCPVTRVMATAGLSWKQFT